MSGDPTPPTIDEAAGAAPVASEPAAGGPHGGINVGAWPPSQPGQTSNPAIPAGAANRPELVVGAAFAGGLVLALLLRRLGSGD